MINNKSCNHMSGTWKIQENKFICDCGQEVVTLEDINVNDSKTRKETPVFSGVLMYFPDAIQAVAQHSHRGNQKHNPGQPLHWDKTKSTDHADCAARHLLDIGPSWDQVDPETGSYHATSLAWRALAILQTILDKKKQS